MIYFTFILWGLLCFVSGMVFVCYIQEENRLVEEPQEKINEIIGRE